MKKISLLVLLFLGFNNQYISAQSKIDDLLSILQNIKNSTFEDDLESINLDHDEDNSKENAEEETKGDDIFNPTKKATKTAWEETPVSQNDSEKIDFLVRLLKNIKASIDTTWTNVEDFLYEESDALDDLLNGTMSPKNNFTDKTSSSSLLRGNYDPHLDDLDDDDEEIDLDAQINAYHLETNKIIDGFKTDREKLNQSVEDMISSRKKNTAQKREELAKKEEEEEDNSIDLDNDDNFDADDDLEKKSSSVSTDPLQPKLSPQAQLLADKIDKINADTKKRIEDLNSNSN